MTTRPGTTEGKPVLVGAAVVLVGLAQAALIALIAWGMVTSLWGLGEAPVAPPGPRRRAFRVVVPAHDEEAVVGDLVGDLRAQDHPGPVRVVVLADRCTDRTADVAVAAGADVVQRRSGSGGKGAALAWLLEREPLHPDEALVVLDADNRVPPDLLARFADQLDTGHDVLQAYLDVVDPDGSVLATAAALTYWAGNRAVQLARRNLGWSCDLGGTGMCLTAGALARAGGFGDELTEDQALTARLVLAGDRAVWLHHVRVRDDKPRRLAVAVQQRARWRAGKRGTARRYVVALLRRAVRARDLGAADLAIRLVQPGRSLVASVTGVLAVVALALNGPTWLLPWPVWAVLAGVQLLLPVVFLMRDHVPARYVLRYPYVTLIALLAIPARVASHRVRRWYHTPHETS